MSDETNSNDRAARKAAAAVEFTQRRLAAADEAVFAAERKVERAQADVTAAEEALAAARADRDVIAVELAAVDERAASFAAPEQSSSAAPVAASALDASIVTESNEG